MKRLHKTLLVKAMAAVSIGLVIAVTTIAQDNKRTNHPYRKTLDKWHSREIKKMVINFSNLRSKEREEARNNLLKEKISERLKVEDFLQRTELGKHKVMRPDELGGNQDIIIKRELVDMFESLITTMELKYKGVSWNFSSAYRSPKINKEVGGTQEHPKGNAFDIVFKIPGLSSEESARRAAYEAHKLNENDYGIAIDKSKDGYSVHINPLQGYKWRAEQDPVNKKQYNPVDPETWSVKDDNGSKPPERPESVSPPTESESLEKERQKLEETKARARNSSQEAEQEQDELKRDQAEAEKEKKIQEQFEKAWSSKV